MPKLEIKESISLSMKEASLNVFELVRQDCVVIYGRADASELVRLDYEIIFGGADLSCTLSFPKFVNLIS